MDDEPPNWDHFMQHSSAIGLVMPDAVPDVFGPPSEEVPGPVTAVPEMPPVRLVRTAHGADGLSVFESDGLLLTGTGTGPGPASMSVSASFALADRRVAVPVALGGGSPRHQAEVKGKTTSDSPIPGCPPTGAALVLADVPPRQAATPALRRTQTLDYAVVLAGEAVVRLDSGAETTVRAGEVVVQQGTRQRWENRGPKPARILWVMLASDKVVLADGRVLEASP